MTTPSPEELSLALGMLRCGCSFAEAARASNLPVEKIMLAWQTAPMEKRQREVSNMRVTK